MKTKVYTRSVAGGIVSPSMAGRIDDSKRDAGVAECRNLIVLPEGIATSRPGTKYIIAAKNAAKKARMVTFRYSTTQTMALEIGEAYIRFHSFGATLLTPTSGVSAWSAVPTYAQGDLVTQGGFTWYAVSAVPANQSPATNEYGAGSPVVTVTWVLTAAAAETPPVGYTYVGSELPATAVLGQLVYIQVTEYDYVQVGTLTISEAGLTFEVPVFDYVPVIRYIGYTGTAGGAGTGYWYKLGTYYEIPTPYAEAHLMDLHYVQSGDVMTFAHPSYAPRELRRVSATKWTLVPITFGSTLSAPTISAVTPTVLAVDPGQAETYSYVATNISDDQTDESVASSAVTASNNIADSGAFNTVTFAGAARRNVYRLTGGLYGFIGQTTTASLVDDNIAPDVSKTPPSAQAPFATDWPGAVSYINQRRAFGGTPLLPQSFWLTRVGAESNLNRSIPPKPDDAVAVRIAAREASTIRHLVPLGDLIVLTSSGEFAVSGGDGPITPANVQAPSTGYAGASNVQPVVVDNDLIFVAARGGHVRGMGYSFDRQSYMSVDLSVRAAHLFDFKTVVDMAFARAPIPIVWFVSSDGRLIGMTYVPAEEVRAFHTHDTAGAFESICAVPEGDEDLLYAVVRRTINEATVRYIEYFPARFYTDAEDAHFVDCGSVYDGAATNTVSGLTHLANETVNVLADGVAFTSLTVSAGGVITLPDSTTASVIHVGLQLYRELETLPVATEAVEGFGQAQVKNVNKVWVRLIDSGAPYAGPDTDSLHALSARSSELYGAPSDLLDGVYDIVITGRWRHDGRVHIIATDPLPLTVASITQEVEFGG